MKYQRIFVSGHRGMVGSAICRMIRSRWPESVTLITRTRSELDLCNAAQVDRFLKEEKPDCIINAAAKVGGIHANSTYPAEFLHENLAINLNLVHGAWQNGVARFLNLGSSCIYPKDNPQPIREDSLLTGPLEPTNEPYAIAKIAGLKLCEYYRKQYGVCYHSAMPCNLYGPGDNYHIENSHVFPALIRRFHEAKVRGDSRMVLWGSGRPMREFLHVDDLADAVAHLLGHENPPDWVNVGAGSDVSILELAQTIQAEIGFHGELTFDSTKPDGMFRKLMDISVMRGMGWEPRISLKEGVHRTYADFLDGLESGRIRL